MSPLFLLALTAATPHRLPPVEHCTPDSGFAAFRGELGRAVLNRDAASLKRLVADDITVNFGGDIGWASFAATWDLGKQPKTSKLWDEMGPALSLGCAVAPDGRSRVLPGMFEKIGDDVDLFDLVAVRAGTPFRATADVNGRVIATLDWHAGTVEAGDGEPWTQVTLLDGRSGWVASDRLVSPIGYRLVAEKRGGRWVVAAFVAGD